MGITFFILLILIIDWYAWQGVKALIKHTSDQRKRWVFAIYWGYTLSLLGFMVMMRVAPVGLPPVVIRFLAALIFSIFIVKLIWSLFLIIDDIFRIFRWFLRDLSSSHVKGHESNANVFGVKRWLFLNYLGLGAAVLFFGSALWGVIKGAHHYQIRRRKVKIKGLPQVFSSLKVIQISDIHCGSFWDRKAVERGIALINKEKPDVVFFTGDLVNDTASEALQWIDVFKKIEAKYGVYSILGNHDYGDYVLWDSIGAKNSNFQLMLKNHQDLGWKLLLDDAEIIELEGYKLAVIGVQNWSEKGKFPKYGNLDKAYHKANGADVKWLLSHDPSHWRAQVLGQKKDISM